MSFGHISRHFLNEDPSGFNCGSNMYAFASGDLVDIMDPFGLGAVDSTSYIGNLANEMNPFNLKGSFAQTSLSIGASLGGIVNGLSGGGWDQVTNAGNGRNNNSSGLLEQTEGNATANIAAKTFLGISGAAAGTATFAGTWAAAAGLPTFSAGVITSPNLHFFYGETADGATTWLHAAGPIGTSVAPGLEGFVGYANTITGIPIIAPAAAAAVGIPAINCLTGLISAGMRGLGF